ncbi:hypothetical protein J3459_022386 [Metarhizium acridum]|uniref:MARVEL domain-containing protein n=1 Tax=Metarhizium acridum (strain CQMa 102) TaxID=655827 RepID=E9E3L9_METAQ|nr:uncharacterized protein MAC_04463 [Metarhizium acridum CQMa 102]EFY89444.1 hypothetical protein MAC_04463 [Metarhizium acridum CQMa 102]KAG8404934.1 hypothetical protein J3459_022386 [Metarhizium acridum]
MSKFTRALKLGQQAAELGSTVQGVRGANKKQIARNVGHLAYGQGASHGKELGKTWLKSFEVIPRLVLRGAQLLLALIICGFYGNRISSESKGGQGIGAVWIYGVGLAGLSAITAISFAAAASAGTIPWVGSALTWLKPHLVWWWDMVLFFAWMAAFGIFAGLFLKRKSDDPYRGSSTPAMKIALWIDLAAAVLWLCSGTYSAIKCFAGKTTDRMAEKAGQKMFGSTETVV